ncbi:MAG: outer membrane lipoprotein carrier protein LolA [Chitinophagia bacterium]|jgi:outer membrane lipoprotein-sorting protein|nr:outer membrane lipoprotein carrier protein LolA [Chitinophagia bacterium]
MRYLLIALFSIIGLNGMAQKDTKAKEVMDQLGLKVKQAKGILANIQLITKNKKGQALGTKSIRLKMKGEKYLLNQGKMEILCDGKNIYNFDGSNSISKSDVGESDQALSPQKLLSGNYDKDFNYNLLSQNAKTATIELYPIDKRKNFQKVTLIIDKLKSALSSASILDKSNNITNVNVVSLSYSVQLADNLFIFNRSKYPKNVEIFD